MEIIYSAHVPSCFTSSSSPRVISCSFSSYPRCGVVADIYNQQPKRGNLVAQSIATSSWWVQSLNSGAHCTYLSTIKSSHCDANLKSKIAVFNQQKRHLEGRSALQTIPKTECGRFLTRRCLTRRSKHYCKCLWEGTSGEVVVAPVTARVRPVLDSRLLSWSQSGSPHQSENFKFWIVAVSTSDEVLAAAILRSQLFYDYPEFSTTVTEGLEGIKARLKYDLDALDLMKSRVKSEFQRDRSMQLLNMKVKCLLAICERSSLDESMLCQEGNPLIALPAVGSRVFSSKPLVAIGTLDVQDGTGTKATVDVSTVIFELHSLANVQKKKNLPANSRLILEPGLGPSLVGVSLNGNSQVKHGYIFNLCVADCVRRKGVATALMSEAELVAKQMQLKILYVHVEAKNKFALALYQKLGYAVEEEESVDVEKQFHRSRRILLSFYFI